jgi:hypothetical protein
LPLEVSSGIFFFGGTVEGDDHRRRAEYILTADLVQESFGEKSLIFLPDEDVILTVNASAAELLGELRRWFPKSTFTEDDLAGRILRNFRLSPAVARREAALIIRSCSKYRLLKKI